MLNILNVGYLVQTGSLALIKTFESDTINFSYVAVTLQVVLPTFKGVFMKSSFLHLLSDLSVKLACCDIICFPLPHT